MPHRFPTEAANAPFLVDDGSPGAAERQRTGRVSPIQRARGEPRPHDPSLDDEARPGRGENQAGFLKDTEPD